jgi:6-pyruvoyltetrahydropterin/6-carboxytetrahydropterin synthase
MVLNMVALDETVHGRVMSRFDHTNLNLDPLFRNQVPTTENLCKAVFELLDGAVDPAKLVQVRVEETENNFFEYSGTE